VFNNRCNWWCGKQLASLASRHLVVCVVALNQAWCVLCPADSAVLSTQCMLCPAQCEGGVTMCDTAGLNHSRQCDVMTVWVARRATGSLHRQPALDVMLFEIPVLHVHGWYCCRLCKYTVCAPCHVRYRMQAALVATAGFRVLYGRLLPCWQQPLCLCRIVKLLHQCNALCSQAIWNSSLKALKLYDLRSQIQPRPHDAVNCPILTLSPGS